MASSSDKNIASSKNLGPTKKRPALADVTNLKNASRSNVRASIGSSKPMVQCVAKIAKTKNQSTEHSRRVLCAASLNLNSSNVVPSSETHFPGDSERDAESTVLLTPNIVLDESTSNCHERKDSGHIDDLDVTTASSGGGKRANIFSISDDVKIAGSTSQRGALIERGKTNPTMDKLIDPRFYATITSDIYRHLRASEVNNRPSKDLMERIQIDISGSMRATLIDWLVEVSEEYRLVRDTLFLTVNYIDRYLSGKVIKRPQLQLLGVTCMMIAAKYEEICPPHVEDLCYITDNTYLKEEILLMESAVLSYLKFEMASPTTICFLRRFISVAPPTSEVLSIQLECMANYIAELSLLDISLICYLPSLIAASAIFLASYVLAPYNKPWNSKLMSCTHYQPSDLHDCVMVLLQLCRCGGGRNLPAVRNKYSQHKYKYVAKKYCSLSIPVEFFEDV